MRKKLFAIVMSIAMLVTFMPAMAFAAGGGMDDPAKISPASQGFYVSGVATTAARQVGDVWVDSFTYDGKEHTVSAVPMYPKAYTETREVEVLRHRDGTVCAGNDCHRHHYPSTDVVEDRYYTAETVTGYTVAYKTLSTATAYPTATPTATPVVKNAGNYLITATVSGSSKEVGDTYYRPYSYNMVFELTVLQREVDVTGLAQIVKTKNYDGKPITIDGNELVASDIKDATGKVITWTGLIAGDSILTGTITTGVDAGVYYYSLDQMINPNYKVRNWNNTNKFVIATINKADNDIICPTSNKTVKAKKVANGPVKLAVKKSATFGTVKMTKLGGSARLTVSNGKIKVRQNTKKGTYKIKIRLYVAGTANYKSVHLDKTIRVRVK